MDPIVKVHEKILKHLIYLRNGNPSLFFMPRKINNQNRLEKGYWFNGNQFYLNISFWNGMDWKQKIHNIGFVILDDFTCYIELSAQDSKAKANSLTLLSNSIGSFTKDPNKNRWYRYYAGKDYIKNLDDFIQNIKPQIDNFIKKNNPNGIYILNNQLFNKYYNKISLIRTHRSNFGKIKKLTRICWNLNNWRYPSGSLGKSLSPTSYENTTGFGHEEWLFDKSKIVDGYHYSFVQALFIKSRLHVKKTYDLNLYTINNLRKKYYVGNIKEIECISPEESAKVYNLYQTNGWIDQMKKALINVNADLKSFIATPPENFFNIKYKFNNVYLPEEMIEISDKDVNITTYHYRLLPQIADFEFVTSDEHVENENEGNKKNTSRRKKVFNTECEFDPYHDQMQNALFDFLKSKRKSIYEKVFIEKGRVDIKARTTSKKWHYFEIKTDNPKQSIRKGLGQILEYSCFPDDNKAEKLFIVSDELPSEDVKKYLNLLRTKFHLPITYRQFNLDQNDLSEDF